MKYLIYILPILMMFACSDSSVQLPNVINPGQDSIIPPDWDEPKPFLTLEGTIDTVKVDTNGVFLPGCDQNNGWAACQLNTVNDLHPATVFRQPDDSVYILTFCDKPNDHFKGELHAVWNYSTGVYEERCNGVIHDFPNGMDNHYLNCGFLGFPGFSCP